MSEEHTCICCGLTIDGDSFDVAVFTDEFGKKHEDYHHQTDGECVTALKSELAELRANLDGSNTITRLENWKAAERCRFVGIGIDDGYGATCWEVVLRRGKGAVLCVESTREHGERIEKDGNLFIRCPATEGDWSGLEAVINCAIDAAEEFWKGAT